MLFEQITSKISSRKKEAIRNVFRNLVYYLWKYFGPNKKKIDTNEIKKIILINKGVIGDLIVSTPMIKALSKRYGKIDILMREDMRDIIYGNKNIKNLYFYDNENKILNLFAKNKYDLAIVFSARDSEIKKLCLKAKIPYVIGNSFSYSLIDIFINARTKENPKQHFVLKALDQAKLAGADLEKDEIKTELFIPKKDEDYVNNLLKKCGIGKYVVVHAGKRGSKTNPKLARFFWSEENFASVIDYIIEKYNTPVVLSGSSLEKERNKEILSFIKNKNMVFNFCEKTNLKQWAALIKNAVLLISLNTGATHIASCFDTKTIVINEEFPELWHPWMGEDKYLVLLQPNTGEVKKAIDKLFFNNS